MRYKGLKIDLLFILYFLEDKQQYKNKDITNFIDKLQNFK